MKRVYVLLTMLAALFGISTHAANLWQFDFDTLSRDGYIADPDRPLVTEGWQFSSPFSQNDFGKEDGGYLEEGVLIDEDASTFWHSYWEGGNVTVGTHYFQVELVDELDPETLIAFVFTRRGMPNDQTTIWSVMATDDPNATKAQCEELAYVETPFSSQTETCMSSPFKRSEYKYLRFYSERQAGDMGARGYFHLTEFNIFPVILKSEEEQAWERLEEVYYTYDTYYDSFEGRTGTDPGDYDEATVEAFLNAMDAYTNLPSHPPVEQILACADQIVATYAAIEPTKVPFRSAHLPNGYYRVKAGLDYIDGDKYMKGVRRDGRLWATWGSAMLEDNQENIQSLWKITAVTDSTFDLQNMYHKGRFTKVARSSAVEMSAQSDSLVVIEAVATDHASQISYVNIRLLGQPDAAASGYLLHQEGHQDGAGIEGNLVGWYNTWDWGPMASEWYFESVPDDEAEEIISQWDFSEDEWRADYFHMQQEIPGLLATAKDIEKIVDADQPLVSDENPVTSPCSDSAEGLNIEYLWDGNTGNFWHSDWHNEWYGEDHHYIQVEIPEEVTSAVIQFTRRNIDSNQITTWGVYGTNEDDFTLISEDLQRLATLTTPYSSTTETLTSEVFETQGYRYIRFYCEATSDANNSKFFHLAEFQVYPGRYYQSPTSQFNILGQTATNLETVYEELKDIAFDAAEKEEYDRLKAAYDAFIDKFVNPQHLRDTITLAENKLSRVVVGTNPGFYPAGSSDALTSTVAAAKSYDEAGAYTKSRSSELLATLKTQMEALDAAPYKVKEGKWYRLRLGTEEEYKTYGWSTSGCYANLLIVDGDTLGYYNEAIFGKYMVVARNEDEIIAVNDDGSETLGHRVIPITADEVKDIALDQLVYFDDEADIKVRDLSLFRFVNVGDSAYAIQNKATGLFLAANRNTNNSQFVRLSVRPSLFSPAAIGWGANKLDATDLAGTNQDPLHFALDRNIMETWNGYSDADGRRGTIFIEEVSDVEGEVTNDFLIAAFPGATSVHCYPVTVTAKDAGEGQMWTVAALERSQNPDTNREQVKITLGQVEGNVAAAGRPFIYVKSGEYVAAEDRYEDDKPELAHFSYQWDLVSQPETSHALKGVFARMRVGQGAVTLNEAGQPQLTTTDTYVGADQAYISDAAGALDRRAEVVVVLDADIADGIADALKTVTRTGGIYTLDGRFIARGNLNSLPRLPKGAYIINGTKVVVN